MIKKQILTTAIAAMALSINTQAQTYGNRTYNARTGQFEYSRDGRAHQFNIGDLYYGLRMGLSFATVNSDDKALDGGSSRTGLDLGVVLGYALAKDVPVFLETGVFYKEKGGHSTYDGKKMTYNLNYIQVPLVVKYSYVVDRSFSIQPYGGGYLAYGIGGKIKNYGDRQAFSSYSNNCFRHFDGGLRLGCGVGYNLFYADISYDIGIANVCRDEFDTSHNRCFTIDVGVNF